MPPKRRMGDDVEALLAAIVGVRTPADIRQKAGSMAQAPLLVRLLGPGRLKQSVGPGTQLCRVLERAGVQPGMTFGEREQRVFAALGLRQQAEQQAFADAEDGEDDLFRLHAAQQALEHERAIRKHLAPRPGNIAGAGDVGDAPALRTCSQKSIASRVLIL